METEEQKYAGTIADISERKQAQRQLQQLNEAQQAKDIAQRQQDEEESRLLAAVVESSDDAIITKTLDGNITSWNVAAVKLFGYSQAEAVGQSISMLFPPERMEEETQLLEHLKRGERLGHFETVRLRKDGTPLDVSVTISPLKDEAGQIVGASKIVRDITERRRKENQLRDITAALNETAIVAITDAQGTITFVNDKFCEISKYSREELLGQNHRILNSGHHPPVFFVQMWRTIAHGRTWRAELKNRAKDGSFYWVDTTIIPFLNARGKPYQYLALRADITERKLAEIKLKIEREEHKRTIQGLKRPTKSLAENNWELPDFAHVSSHDLHEPLRKIQAFGNRLKMERKQAEIRQTQLIEQLERSNRDLQDFAYVASHDLQEPLRKISSFAKLLAEDYQGHLDAEADEYIAYIIDGAVRMQNLIDDLLTYSRASSHELKKEPTKLGGVLAQVLEDLSIFIEENNAAIAASSLPTVQANPRQMGQLLQNLIGNGIKFHGSAPPRIHIEAQWQADQWLISVSDNGIGLDPKFAQRIFGIFQRLHGRGEYVGTGIGLAICRKIVERHGGRIWVESELGQGATFYFTIPRGSCLK